MCSSFMLQTMLKNTILLALLFVVDGLYLYKHQDDVRDHENWPLLDLEDHCGRSTLWRTDKSIGGHNADLAEYPWMARLIYRSQKNNAEKGNCGGSVINNRYILTAAHCCTSNNGDQPLSIVRLGEYDIHRTKDCFRGKCAPPPLEYGVEEVIQHYKFDLDSLKNDICLVRLSEDIEFNDYVQPICLPTTEDMMKRTFVGSVLTVAGWGMVEEEPVSRLPNVLQEVRIRVVSGRNCISNKTTDFFDQATEICAGDPRVRDACYGDSGGPLMYNMVDGGAAKHYLVGVVSSGDICSHKNAPVKPGYYTKVSQYITWILDVIH